MDKDEFWEKDLLRANKDLLFSCSVFGPVDYINGLRTCKLSSHISSFHI